MQYTKQKSQISSNNSPSIPISFSEVTAKRAWEKQTTFPESCENTVL